MAGFTVAFLRSLRNRLFCHRHQSGGVDEHAASSCDRRARRRSPCRSPRSQGYPNRPVRLVVADSAGGAPDQLARLVAQKVSESLGQQLIVDNRAGAGGAVGAESVAKSPPDGYTLLLTTTAVYAILPNLRKDLPYDPVRDFVSVARIATASNVLVINNALPAQNVAELVRYAKERPGTLNYASAGIGTPAHLAGEMLNLLADIKVTHIPYKGAAPGLLGIAGNARSAHHHLSRRRCRRAHGAGRARDRSTGTDGNPVAGPSNGGRHATRLRDHAVPVPSCPPARRRTS